MAEAAVAPQTEDEQIKCDFARRIVLRQLSDFSAEKAATTLLITFTPDWERAYEYCSSGDSAAVLKTFQERHDKEEHHTTYDNTVLANAPTPLLQLNSTLLELQQKVGRLASDIVIASSSGPTMSAAQAAAQADPVPPGTSHQDSLLMSVAAMEVVAGLADPRQVRLPNWGTSLACLMVYKQILLTGMWRGQPVRVVDQMYLDLDLMHGEVYLCTQPWLFQAQSGKGALKPRHDHHTFKFQRQIIASKSTQAEVTFRKARCARKKCSCSDDAAFELIGVKLTFCTRPLALYHFRRTPINSLNVHPRRFALGDEDDDDD